MVVAKFGVVDHSVATEGAVGAFDEASSHAGEAPQLRCLLVVHVLPLGQATPANWVWREEPGPMSLVCSPLL